MLGRNLLVALICVIGLSAVLVSRRTTQRSVEADSSRRPAEALDEGIFAPVREPRNNSLAIALGTAAVGMILGVILALPFSKRLARRQLADSMSTLEADNRALTRLNREREEEITQRARTAEDLWTSQDATRMILDSIPVGVAVVGHDRIVRQINSAALRLMGRDSADEIVGRICQTCFRPAEGDKCPVLDLKQEFNNSEQMLLAKDGSEIPILKTVIRVRLGEEDVLLETFVDIGDRKQVEEDLRRHLAALEEANQRLEILVTNTTEREKRMVLLKQEVNDLLKRLGHAPKYQAPGQIAQQGLQVAWTND